MQVQLLNLLRVILFQSAFCESAERKKNVTTLLSSNLFIPKLLQGLTTVIPYVRVQFIKFISDCIPILANFTTSGVLTKLIKSILSTYFEIIQNLQREDDDQAEDYEEMEYDYYLGNEEDQAPGVSGVDNPNDKKFERTPTIVFANKRTSTINDAYSDSRLNSVANVSAVLNKGKSDTNHPTSKDGELYAH
jgi:hypothetical protein